ncbi:MAG: PAS domain S-box protein [Lewinellaceae bacterium]|nr:PAS domain S-box protein [Lewinellaceae bacterium]
MKPSSEMIELMEKGFDFENFLNTHINGILAVREDGRLLLADHDATTLLGYSPSQLNGQPVSLILPKLQLPIAGQGRPQQGHTIAIQKNGEEIPVSYTVRQSPAEVEERIFFLLLFQDVAEKQKAGQDLMQSQKTLEAVINTAVDGIIIIDKKGIMQMANPAASRLFGYEVDEMRGQNVNILMPSPHAGEHDGYISNYLKTGTEKIIGIGREVEGLRKDGARFPFKLGVSRVELEGKVLFAGVIHDLTEQKRAEARILYLNKELEQKVEERTEKLTEVVNKLLQSNIKLEREIKERKAAEAALRQKQEQLRRSLEKEKELSELKSRFVSMASHEFRTPLTTIASSTELLGLYTESGQQEKRDKHLRRIKSAVTNLTGILGDFLSLSKLEEGKIQVNPVPFTLENLGEEVVEEMQSLLKPGQQLRTDFRDVQQNTFLDKKILKNIFINLLSNAIKYSGERSTVHFELFQEGQTIRAAIRDEGIGIPKEDQKHLFTRFFRATNSVNIQGTGLGLNIVKRYIDLLDGRIWFESKEGEGTAFFIEITWQKE